MYPLSPIICESVMVDGESCNIEITILYDCNTEGIYNVHVYW